MCHGEHDCSCFSELQDRCEMLSEVDHNFRRMLMNFARQEEYTKCDCHYIANGVEIRCDSTRCSNRATHAIPYTYHYHRGKETIEQERVSLYCEDCLKRLGGWGLVAGGWGWKDKKYESYFYDFWLGF